MTDAPTLQQFPHHPQRDLQFHAHEKLKNVLIDTFIRPNGVINGGFPEGVPQNELLRPHFAVDRPIPFEHIKAGDTGVWFQRRNPSVTWYDGRDHSVILPAGRIISTKPVLGAEGTPYEWDITLEAPTWTKDHPDFLPDGDTVEGELTHRLTAHNWQAYQRHLWLPLGWGTPEGYPTSMRAGYDALKPGDIMKIVEVRGSSDDEKPLAALAQRTVHLSEGYIEAMRAESNTSERLSLTDYRYVLYPPITLDDYEGQGDRIPDMPGQGQGDQPQPAGGAGGSGDGSGAGSGAQEPAEEEIPPMPGEQGYKAPADLSAKLDHIKQKGWWGSTTG